MLYFIGLSYHSRSIALVYISEECIIYSFPVHIIYSEGSECWTAEVLIPKTIRGRDGTKVQRPKYARNQYYIINIRTSPRPPKASSFKLERTSSPKNLQGTQGNLQGQRIRSLTPSWCKPSSLLCQILYVLFTRDTRKSMGFVLKEQLWPV